MQRRILQTRSYFAFPDFLILFVIGAIVYGVVAMSTEWRADFRPDTEIILQTWALPRYALLSAGRGLVAYLISLAFTLVVGYAAAKSRRAERVIIPAIDILQSIPVLGFLPGLVLGLISPFPRSNFGLELAAILMVFTGQVWNMTLSYYSSLKSIPSEMKEAATVMNLGLRDRLLRLELPYSAMDLAWNSLMSMAGGWFFLSVCESFTLGDAHFKLPGIGAYMAVAIERGDSRAMVLGVITMVLLIVAMDVVIWRPVLAWVQRFRLEQGVSAGKHEEPLMRMLLRESRVLQFVRFVIRRFSHSRRRHTHFAAAGVQQADALDAIQGALNAVQRTARETSRKSRETIERNIRRNRAILRRCFTWAFVAVSATLVGIGLWKLGQLLLEVPFKTWVILIRNTGWTLLRVSLSLLIGTLWAVPVGIWIGTSPARTRAAQPVLQVLASFPAPMLYPLALSALFHFGISFDWASMFLMQLGVQWYIVFNVLAGSLRVPQELRYALDLMEASRFDRWRRLYIPSVFPSLVTGWVTAAGGAWNASIVAEYVSFRGEILVTSGLGSTISAAASGQDFPLLAAALAMMVAVVLALNHGVWSKVYALAQGRFRMEL